jgi:hypothetical protein
MARGRSASARFCRASRRVLIDITSERLSTSARNGHRHRSESANIRWEQRGVAHTVPSTAPPLMQQQIHGVLHRTRQCDFSGVHKKDLIHVVDRIQAVGNNYLGGFRRQHQSAGLVV